MDEKLNEGLQQYIIERVNGPSPWISPIVPVLKDNEELRLCVDMRQANRAILRENCLIPVFDNIITRLNGVSTFLDWTSPRLLHTMVCSITNGCYLV